jgi:hypothetical protein
LLGTLESDRQTALALKKEVVKELKNVEIAARTIERFNTPMAAYNQNNQLPSKCVWVRTRVTVLIVLYLGTSGT